MEKLIDVRNEELNLLDQELLEARNQEKRCRQRKKILEEWARNNNAGDENADEEEG